MKQPGLRRTGEFIGEGPRLLRRNVEPKDFDGDEPVTCWLVCPEHRAERDNADLMQHPEGAERGRWGECRRVVSGQERKLLGGLMKFSTKPTC